MTWPSTIASVMAVFCLFLAAMSLRLSRASGWSAQRWIAFTSLSSALYIGLDIPITLNVGLGWMLVLNYVQNLAAGALTASWIVHTDLLVHGPPVSRLSKGLAVSVAVLSALIGIPGLALTGRVASFYLPIVDATYRTLEPTTFASLALAVFPIVFLGLALRLAAAWRQGVVGVAPHCVTMGIVFVAAANDALVWSGVTRMPLVVDVFYAAPVTVAVLCLTNRVVREAGALADLSRQLERRVEERTAQLRAAVARYHTTLASIGDGLISVDPEGRIDFMNRVAERLTGWSLADVRGRSVGEVFSIVSRSTQATGDDLVQRVLKDGLAIGLLNDTTLVARDGTKRKIADSCAPIRDSEGHVLGAVLVFRDVTEEYARRDELRRSEQRYRELFSNMQDAVAVYDAVDDGQDFVIREFNAAACRAEGITRDQVIGRRVTERFPGVEEMGLLAVLQRVAATATPAHLPVCQYQDGRICGWRENSVYRLPTGEVVAIYRDLTEQKKAEEDQRQLETQLRQAQKLEAVGQLAAGIAHEINTPTQFIGDSLDFLSDSFRAEQELLAKYQEAVGTMAGTPGFESALQTLKGAEDAADHEYIKENAPAAFERALDGIARIAAIVRAMKEFAHPDQREKSPADLNHALETTLTIARNEYKYVADIETDFGELPPVACHLGDLNQAFLNLLVNAAHAIADVVGASGGRGRIRVSTRHEGSTVRIQIADTGRGIPENIRDRIFEPFFTTKEVGRGSGQGLPIARSVVVERHGGALTFESEIGKGTTFTITLPIIDGSKNT